MARIKTVLAALIAQFIVLASPAFADYMPPEQVDWFTVIASEWSIVADTSEGGSTKQKSRTTKYKVHLTQNGKQQVWPIDLFLMSHNEGGDDICGGTYIENTTKLIEDIRAKKGSNGLMLKFNSATPGGALRVAGLHLYNEEETWNTAIQYGSQMLNLSAEKVRQLGKAQYKAAVFAKSDEAWKKIVNRPAATETVN